MRWLRFIAHRLRSVFRKEEIDTEMNEEMRLHLEMQVAQNVERGMNPEEARFAAQREFGGVEQIKEQARDQRGWLWLEDLLRDLGFRCAHVAPANPGLRLSPFSPWRWGLAATPRSSAALINCWCAPCPWTRPRG